MLRKRTFVEIILAEKIYVIFLFVNSDITPNIVIN